jgi:hypothetical protein
MNETWQEAQDRAQAHRPCPWLESVIVGALAGFALANLGALRGCWSAPGELGAFLLLILAVPLVPLGAVAGWVFWRHGRARVRALAWAVVGGCLFSPLLPYGWLLGGAIGGALNGLAHRSAREALRRSVLGALLGGLLCGVVWLEFLGLILASP